MDIVAQLKAENEALKSQLQESKEEVKKLQKLNDWYIEKLKLRAKEKFGTSSEKMTDGQISLFDLFNEAETIRKPICEEPDEDTVLIPSYKRKRHPERKTLENLPVETIEYKLSDDEMICDECGSKLTEMKKEVRRELQIIPAQVKVVEHVTHVYSCRNCDKNGIGGFIKKAKSQKALFPKSMASASLTAYIMNQKYSCAVPLYRQEQEFKRLGVNLSRQNLSNWVIKGAALLKPLLSRMKESLLKEELLHADETVLEVLNEPGRTSTCKSYMWLYRTSTYCQHPVIIYDYSEGRSGAFAVNFLKDWEGKYLHCDGYSGYKKLENITLCGCLVHAKRKFHEAWEVNKTNEYANTGMKYIQKLFALEKYADNHGFTYDERLAFRIEKSKPVMDEFLKWNYEISQKALPKSMLGKAVNYVQNQKEYLSSFLKDGRIQLSNNLAELSIKPFVIGRKNFLFCNTPNGADASAIVYSVIQTAVANGIKPQQYLEHVFKYIQENEYINYDDILPWSQNIPDDCKANK